MQKEHVRSLDRRLVAYAIASATVVGGGSLAEAGVIRSGALDVSLSANAPFYYINLDGDTDPNNDPRYDAAFIFGDSDGVTSLIIAVRPNDVDAAANRAGIVVDGSTSVLAKDAAANLSGGFTIGESLSSFNWNAGADPGDSGFAKIHTWDTATGASLEGNFPGVTEKYVGFRLHLSSNEDLVYGWAKISTVGNLQDIGVSGDIILHEWAYESTAGAPITTGAVPEPTSLAIFAMGGAGIAAWKRRRKVA